VSPFTSHQFESDTIHYSVYFIIYLYNIQMATNPACPPIPTRDELFNSGDFFEVDRNDLVPNETVVLSLMNGMVIQCMEIVALNNPVGTIRYRLNGMEWLQQINEFAPPQVRFFKKYRRPVTGGRRKSKGTKRRTRKNKRKSTRRTGRKYQK
jgi:hypothetical protein